VNLVATVNRMRAPGLAWRRLAPFSWAATASAYLLLVVGPAMLAALVMLFIDRNFDGVFFAPGEGGAPLLYEHLATIYLTGAWAIVVVVAAGLISEVLPTFAGKPLFSHRGAAASLIAIAALAPLAWMQGMYEAPLAAAWPIVAMLFAVALVVPVGTLLFIWVATLWRGALRLRAPALYAIAAMSTLTFGFAAALAHAVVPVGWLLDNTTAAQAASVYVLVGGAVIGGFAGLHYWFAKLSGRLLGEGLGKLALGAMVVGVHAYCLPMLLAGLEGQPVDAFQYFEGSGLAGYNLVASLGAFVLAVGVLLQLANVAYSYANGRRAGHDPWGASTLEWFALSPPPPHNFDVVPDVRSAEPMREIREAVRARAEMFEPPALARTEPVGDEQEPETSAGGHPPEPPVA
jgi:cytochrome c oxidase subunit I